jgi:hypothetical protein
MKLNTLWILGICLLAAACQKRKYPEEKVQLEKEDIFCDGYINGEPVNLKIGADGYYCYSSYKQGTDSIYLFEAELRKFDCQPCPRSFRVELSDYRQRLPGSSVPVDSALRVGGRYFIPGLPKAYFLRFASHANKEVASVRWMLSNGAYSQDSAMSCEFAQPGAQTVSLTVRTTNNCESMVVNRIFVGGESGLFACTVKTESLQINNSQFRPVIIGGRAPFHYTWYFGDGSTSNLAEPTHNYQWAGSYPVKLRIEDAENHACESNYIHIAGNDPSSCAANMSLSRTGSRNTTLNGVKLQWTDQSNAVLRSDSVAQPAGSYFEVVSSQPYEANERGEAGRLLTLRFNVLLSDGSRKVWFKSENTTVAVTYK